MRNGTKSALRIGLSSTGTSLLRTSGWLRTRTDLLSEAQLEAQLEADAAALPDQLSTQLDRMLAEAHCAGLPATIVLAHELVRMFIVTPPRNATSLQDCLATAAMRFQSLYGEPPSAWQLEGDWSATRPFLVCAMPQALRIALLRVAATHHLHVIQLVPQFIAAWNRWSSTVKTGSWFGVSHENRLMLGATDVQGLRAIWSVPLPATGQMNQLWLQELVQREALRLDLPLPHKLQLSGMLPASWTAKTVGSLACERLDAHLLKSATSPHIALALAGTSA